MLCPHFFLSVLKVSTQFFHDADLQSLTQKKSNFASEKAKLSCLAGWLSFALPQAKLLFFCVKDCSNNWLMIWPWHHGLDVVFSYVLLHVVKFGEPRWDKCLAWGENMYHFKHSSKFRRRGYLWFRKFQEGHKGQRSQGQKLKF